MPGYYRFPTVRDGTVVFVHDDDLWSVPLQGGEARRLTTSRAHVSHPRLSPDGSCIAYIAADEGLRDAYLVDARGGTPRRLTWEGDVSAICGWTPDGRAAVVATSAGQPFHRPPALLAVPADGSPPHPMPTGPALGWDHGAKGKQVLCRHVDDIARWKRYRGGRAGALWVDRTGDGTFERLIELDGNAAAPMWIGRRIWFVSDHEHWGNLYSVTPSGKGLRQHTAHTGLYVRHPSHDGTTVVYARGGELWRLKGVDGPPERIPIETRASADQARRRFIQVPRFVQGIDLHPSASAVALEVRGRPFSMPHFEGPVRQHGERDGVRYRLPRWTGDGKRLLTASDRGGVDRLEWFTRDGSVTDVVPEDMGRPVELAPCPTDDRVAVANHRQEIGLVDPESGAFQVLDRAEGGPIAGMDWSPDGAWLAWGRPEAGGTGRICLWHADHGVVELTDGRHSDWGPSWDPDGKLLYFLSRRDYDPVYDAQYFDLNFPRGSRPWAVTLSAETPHPFRARPRPVDRKGGPRKRRTEPPEITIDLDGLSARMVPMPVRESLYFRLVALPGGNLLMTRRGPQGSLGNSWADGGPPKGDKLLLLWDAHKRELTAVHDAVTDFGVDLARRSAWVRSGWKIRVFKADADKGTREELKKTRGGSPGRRSSWLDPNRIRCSVDPRAEWRQVFDESWRMVRQHFWDAGLSGIDWDAVHARYAPLVDRVSTREELSDVIWTLQGELGTSHAYEMGGDVRRPPRWTTGRLAADFDWDAERGSWVLSSVCQGDPGLPSRSSPLREPGVNAQPGEALLAINGEPLSATHPPARALAHQGSQLVRLTLADAGGETREVVVRARSGDRQARYRDWVRRNRERVHAESGGRCGYVHIPDMGPGGYADFHRDFGVESRKPCLVVDVRYNRGGHVSQLLLEKLARRPLAWTVSRWSAPQVYPRNATLGPMICLTNEYAGSDGDIFSHNWKQLGLGPLVGRRTWGGVVGIWPRHRLADGTITTQPEFAFWFPDVGWGIENRGTEPDVDVDIAPHEWAAGRDPQLDHAIGWVLEQLEASTPEPPDFSARPDLSGPDEG